MNIFLPSEKVVGFFQQHQIPLQEEKVIPEFEVHKLVLEADKLGRAFTGFIVNTVINPTHTGILTNFHSMDDMYESYVCFMAGFFNGGEN